MDSAFLDLRTTTSRSTPATEKRQRYNLAEAIEGPKLKDEDGKDKDGYRALVFADADLFARRARPERDGPRGGR